MGTTFGLKVMSDKPENKTAYRNDEATYIGFDMGEPEAATLEPKQPELEAVLPDEPNPHAIPYIFLRFWRRLSRYVLSLIFEFVGLTVWLVFAEALRNLLERIYGDPKFFDWIPIRYVIDLGELFLLLTFFVVAVRKLWRDSDDD